MMIIITFCALDILILEFLPCKWQLVWNMLIKIIIIKKIIIIIIIIIIIVVVVVVTVIVFASSVLLPEFQKSHGAERYIPRSVGKSHDTFRSIRLMAIIIFVTNVLNIYRSTLHYSCINCFQVTKETKSNEF